MKRYRRYEESVFKFKLSDFGIKDLVELTHFIDDLKKII
jgi:hypothetical protein